MYTPINGCRSCNFGRSTSPGGIKIAASNEKLIPVLNLGIQPLANDFRKEFEARAGWAPLEVLFCPRCTLAQLSVVVDPAVLYDRYPYRTSNSQTMLGHFDALSKWVTEAVTPFYVMEIGSNDGAFLEYLCKAWGISPSQVVGIDPAINLTLAMQSRARAIRTVPRCWCSAAKDEALTILGRKPDVIFARHVFCHADNWREFLLNLHAACGENTVAVIEVPYVVDQIKNLSFDQCLPAGQKIISENGIVEIQDVQLGDRVLTHMGTMQTVTHTFQNPFDGELTEITAYGQNIPLRLTGSHPVYVLRDASRQFVEARRIQPGDLLLKPRISTTRSKGKLSISHPRGRGRIAKETAYSVNAALCKIMGFYLAEGYYFECKPGAAQVSFAFGKSASEKDLARECLDSLCEQGARARMELSRYGWRIHTSGHMARLLRREMGTGARFKHVPPWLFLEREDLIRVFLESYIKGDGYVYRSGKYWRASTVSINLAQGVAVLANKLGFAASVNIGKPLGVRQIHNNPKPSFLTLPPIDILIRLKPTKNIKAWCDGEFQYGLVRKVLTRHYVGTVHNLEVGGESSYVPVQGAVHNCYHEHLSYLSIRAMREALVGTGLYLGRIRRFPIHGGVIALMLKRGMGPLEDLGEEITVETWLQFAKRTERIMADLASTLMVIKHDGGTLAGYGASAKSTVWIQKLGWMRKDLGFICDNTPEKLYCTSPGTDIPIVDEGALLREMPSHTILFAWNFTEEILQKESLYRSKGGKFIIPLPELRIV